MEMIPYDKRSENLLNGEAVNWGNANSCFKSWPTLCCVEGERVYDGEYLN